MFSVYGVTGRVFTGTVEQLRHIDKVNAVARLHPIEANDLVLEPELSVTPYESETPHPKALLPATAVAAYAQASQPDTPRQPLDRVGLLMTQPAVTVRTDAPLAMAAALLARHRVGQMPVVDTQGQLVGLLLRADIYPTHESPSATDWADRMALPVASVMWTPVASVTADTDIRRVAQVLLDTHLPGLPVVDDNGTLTGFIGRTDILRAVANDPPLDVWG
ncbi:inosine-5'-monophosphate dehydrogenase [Comamonadaceae bacterium OS-1]|nr:inosine-5'-monophosphate dehydrogenase [Comamonadaceae bacterium OS-1]